VFDREAPTPTLPVRRKSVPSQFRCTASWVKNPAERLIKSADPSRQKARSQPIVATLKKKTSGSIDGEAIQKAITGGSGTPPNRRAATMGITEQEQKGLKAPTAVARKIARIGLARRAFSIHRAAPERFTATATGIVISKKGQIWRKAPTTKSTIRTSS
jgi:hypothetical protein